MQIKNIDVNVKSKKPCNYYRPLPREDDMMTIYSEVTGSYTYESQAEWKITLPEISAKYITV
jgi:hypothetical protein